MAWVTRWAAEDDDATAEEAGLEEVTTSDSCVETLPDPVSEVVAVDWSEEVFEMLEDDSSTGAELTRGVTLTEADEAVVDSGPIEELREEEPGIDVVEETKEEDSEVADEEELSELE